jgi:murein tripeptide amidase MpaA
MPAIPVPRFDQFYRHAELTRLLQDYATAAPGLVELQSLGRSHEGRDIWVATVTNTGHRRGRRQAGLLGRRQHPRRRAHRQHRLLYFLHQLVQRLRQTSAQITQLLDTRTSTCARA